MLILLHEHQLEVVTLFRGELVTFVKTYFSLILSELRTWRIIKKI